MRDIFGGNNGRRRADEGCAAGRSAGFELRGVGSYVVSGPTADARLAGLRAALGKVAGVERLDVTGAFDRLVAGELRPSSTPTPHPVREEDAPA